ncbi:MAG: WxL domain-containing protein [Turicibacter sp.]|nr:WxL domain-containing protein [Turicibacter sp.]
MKKFKTLLLGSLGLAVLLTTGSTVFAESDDTTQGDIVFTRGSIDIGGPDGQSAPSIDFGIHTITSGDRTYDGTPSSPVTVTDNRGTEEGWSVTVRQSTEFTQDTHTLAGSEIRIGNIAGAATTTGSNLILSPSEATSIVAGADSGSGAGVNHFDLESIVLHIPAGVNTMVGAYQADLVWTVLTTP